MPAPTGSSLAPTGGGTSPPPPEAGTTARHLSRRMMPLLFAVPFLVVIAIWALAKEVFDVSDSVVPSIGGVLSAVNNLVDWGVLPHDVSRSLFRVAIGSVLAAVIGVPIGLLIGINRYSVIMFGPFLRFFQAVSGIAILPLLIVWFGFSETTIQVVILYSALIPVIFNTMVGVRTIPPVYKDAVEVLGGGSSRLVRDIYVPGALASIVVGIRLGVAFGWRALIAGEMLVGAGGLGFMIFDARQFHQLGQMVAGMIIIGILYLIIDRLILASIEDATVGRWGVQRS